MRRVHFALAFCAALLAGSATTSHAQSIGFKLGAAMSNLDFEPERETDGLTGFAGGGFIRFGFGRLGIQPELLTVTRGFEFASTLAGDTEIKLEYIEIPVLLHLPLTMGSAFAPYVFGGPSFAFEVGCDGEDNAGSFDCDDNTSVLGDRKSTDIGITAGGGLSFAMGPGALLIEGRYTWGTTDLNGLEGTSAKSRTAMFMAGYSIPLTR